MSGRWGEEPFGALTPALALGIAISPWILQYWFAALALASAALTGAAALALFRGRRVPCLCLILWALALDGLLLALAERDGFRREDIRALLASGSLPLKEQLLLDGCVLEDSVKRDGDTIAILELHGYRRKDEWTAARGKLQLLIAQPDAAGVPEAILQYGDRIRAWAACDVPRNFHNPGSSDRIGMLARRGISLLARVKSPRLIEIMRQDFGTPWQAAVASVRRSFRDRLSKLTDATDPRQSAILASIVLGDYTELAPETRTEFQNAGTFHVLVVSGLHVSTIAWISTRLFRWMRLPPAGAGLLAAWAIFFFTSLVGFQASITRALWMFILYLVGQTLFRRAAPSNIVLACAFLLLVIHPAWLQDTGFQLSFLSVAAIVWMGLPFIEQVLRPWLDPIRHAGDPERLCMKAGKWRRRGRCMRFRAEIFAEACADAIHPALEAPMLAAFRSAAAFLFMIGSMVLISLSVQAWLGPALAFYFNRLTWIAPVANLAVVPLSSLVLIAGIIAGGMASALSWAQPALRLAGAFSSLLADINRWFAFLPGAWQRCPTPPGIWVIAGVLLAWYWCFVHRRRLWMPCALLWLEISVLSLAEMRIMPSAGLPAACRSGQAEKLQPLRISFLDVGQGDALIVQFPDGRTWAVDAGGLWRDASRQEDVGSFDIGEAVVSRFLWSRWIVALDRVVLTHPHQDHAGGMPALLQNFPVGRLDYGNAGSNPIQSRVLDVSGRQRVPIHASGKGEEYMIAGVVVRVLHPADGTPGRSLNDGSVVLHLEYNHFSALLAGDIEDSGEKDILSCTPELKSQLLKVAHHGSRSSTSERFLERAQPRWAVISAGRGNPFQNPSQETILRLLRHRARLLLTMDQGAIFFETDGAKYSLSSYRLGILEQGIL
jgi:competence protein ComEC